MVLGRMPRALSVWKTPSLSTRSDDDLLNYALELAQEWGHQYFTSVRGRLKEAFSNMSQGGLDRIDSVIRATMKCGHQLVYSMTTQNINDEIAWRRGFLAQHSWVNERNLRRIYASGKYYAWHDGLAHSLAAGFYFGLVNGSADFAEQGLGALGASILSVGRTWQVKQGTDRPPCR